MLTEAEPERESTIGGKRVREQEARRREGKKARRRRREGESRKSAHSLPRHRIDNGIDPTSSTMSPGPREFSLAHSAHSSPNNGPVDSPAN